MKHSESKFGSSARKSLIDGAREVYGAVSTTLGPRGRNIVLWKHYQTRVQHDGVTCANAVNPEDPFLNAGAAIIKEAARRQVEVVGDGTSVAVVLGYAIASEALQIVESGVNPMALRSGLEKGKNILVENIGRLASPIKTKDQKVQIATVSSENEELGGMIGETLHKHGEDAAIIVEGAVGIDTFMEHREGMQIDSGYKHQIFVTNPKDMTATVTKAVVLVTDYKLDNIHDLIPLFESAVAKSERNIVVIAEDIEGSVLATMARNKMEGKINFLAIKAPSFQREEILQDIAIVTGATFVSRQMKTDLKKLTIEDLGYAEQVISTKDATAIIGGDGEKKEIVDRIASIRKQLEDETREFNKEKLRERLAKLTGGLHIVNVGGNTETEVDEKKERAKDAVLATKAAIRSGIVPGGEVIFLSLDDLTPKSEDEDYAYRILKKALRAPFDKLLQNAGLDPGEMKNKLGNSPFGCGVDVTTGEIKNMIKSGIIDPALVPQEAIKNAVSIAISIITSDGIVAEIEDEPK